MADMNTNGSVGESKNAAESLLAGAMKGGNEKPKEDGAKGPENGDTVDSLKAKIDSLSKVVEGLTGEEAKAGRETLNRLTVAMEKLSQDEPQSESPINPADMQAWKEKMDKLATEDFTGTVITLSKQVASNITRDLSSKVEKLTEAVNTLLDTNKKAGETTAKQQEAMGAISEAFKSAGIAVNEHVWNEAVEFYRENLGIDLVSQAYSNKEGLKKSLAAFIRTQGKSGAGSGFPSGGGSGVGQHKESDAEILNKKMKSFGLIR